MTENLDAMRALEHVDIADREVFRAVLAATLVKHQRHRARSTRSSTSTSRCSARLDDDELLDGRGRPTAGSRAGRPGPAAGGGHADVARRARRDAARALMKMDHDELRRLAAMAVQQFAGMEPGRPVGGTYYLYRTLRQLDLDGLTERLMGQARQQGEVGGRRARRAPAPRGVRGAARRSSASWSRRRSGGGSSPTVASRRWRARCASRCPRTSTSCTRRATRCSRSSGRSTR